MDYKAATRVSGLVTSLTDSKCSVLDEVKLKELKGLLRTNEQLVCHAHGLITDRLAANHSQTRKLALQLCDLLFARSKAFRRLLTAQFGQFVELTVGHKSDKPLPAPPAAAIELRQQALEAIEKWHEQWGLQYPQVSLAYKYLKKHYKFPEIASRAAAAAAAQAARQQRRQQMLRQRYEAFQLDFPQQQQQMQSLLRQMEECFELLQQPVQHVVQQDDMEEPLSPAADHQAVVEQHATVAQLDGNFRPADGSLDEQQLGNDSQGSLRPDGGALTAGDIDAQHVSAAVADVAHSSEAAATAGAVPPDQDWEDVVPAVQQQMPGGGRGGVASIDDDGAAGDYDGDELVGDFQDTVPDPAASARQATVLEQLADLAKQAQLLTSRTLLDWLRLLTQLQLGEREQQQQRQHLRAVVDLRAQLQGSLQEAANWNIVPNPRGATNASDDQNRDRLQVGDASTDPSTDAHSKPDLSQLPSRNNQPLHLPQRLPGSQAPAAGHIAFASGLRRSTHQGSPQQQQQQQADVYAGLQDPTAAGRGIYIIPTKVRQAAEEGRWVWNPQTDSSDSEQLQTEAGAAASSAAHQGRSTAKVNQSAAQQQPASQTVKVKEGKGLDASLRQKLAAAAPKLPIAGEDWLLAQHGVSSHGMELYNHWGAVDSTTALPQDRLKELVGYTASYYKPSKKRQKIDEAGPRDSRRAASLEAGAIGHAAAASRASASSGAADGPATRDTALPAGSSSRFTAGQQTADRSAIHWAAPSPSGNANALPAPSNEGSKDEHQIRAPSQRNSASAHNRAVLAAAHSDEAVAAALQQQLNAEAAQAQVRKGRARKQPETKADKLRKKLLGSK